MRSKQAIPNKTFVARTFYIKMSPQPPSIHLLPPPGPSVLLLSTGDASSAQGTSTVPQLFLAAHKVRFEVFVIEQHCSAANEIDADDATSWHWVIYAPLSPPPPPHDRRAWLESSLVGKAPEEEGNYFNKKNDKTDSKIEDEALGSVIPVATIRLVPFPPSHSAAAPPSGEGGAAEQQPSHTATKMWNGKEAYIKLGRLATLRSHRGLGFGRVLTDSALKWAVENASTVSERRQPRAGEEEEEEDSVFVVGGEKEEEEVGSGWNGLVLVHAQRNAEEWYRCVGGFVTDEGMGVWMEEGIEHVGMWRRLEMGGKGGGGS